MLQSGNRRHGPSIRRWSTGVYGRLLNRCNWTAYLIAVDHGLRTDARLAGGRTKLIFSFWTPERQHKGGSQATMTADNFHVYSSHALLGHKLALLRDRRTPPARFSQLLKEISLMLLSHATADLPTREVPVITPCGLTSQRVLAQRVGFAPILRAGAGMIPAAQELMPGAPIWYLGLYRDETTMRPVRYYDKVESYPPVDIAFILDPMLATGGSAVMAATRLKQKGVDKVVFVGLIAAPEGVKLLHDEHPDVEAYVAALDERLNESAYIVPGLGDAGDRQNATGANDPTDDPFVPEETAAELRAQDRLL
jgi:uracil phosphoribosyltransferase